MRVFGLTGGIASGKSIVAGRLAEHGAVIVDSDVLARDAVAPGTPGLAAIAAEFGPRVLTPEGALDRAALAGIVFSDDAARARLNGILHPEIARLGDERIVAAAAIDPDVVIVYDIPLLAEAGPRRRAGFESVIVVHAPLEERLRRMVEHRGMSEEEALGRIAAQATDEERLAIADVVIDNGGPVEETLRQVDELWASIRGGA